MTLQITFKNNLKVLKYHLSGTAIMFLALLFFKFDKIFVLAAAFVWIMYTIPVLFLHINYYFKNLGQVVTILDDSIELRNKKKEVIQKFYKSEIKKIILCRSATLDEVSFRFLPSEYYQYIKIISKSKDEIFISCLMSSDLDAVLREFEGISFERIKGIRLN